MAASWSLQRSKQESIGLNSSSTHRRLRSVKTVSLGQPTAARRGGGSTQIADYFAADGLSSSLRSATDGHWAMVMAG